jgi:hypothetical protein
MSIEPATPTPLRWLEVPITFSQIAFSIWFSIARYQDNTSTTEDIQEKHSGMLGDYSRRLQDYSKSAGIPSSLEMIQAFLRTSNL